MRGCIAAAAGYIAAQEEWILQGVVTDMEVNGEFK